MIRVNKVRHFIEFLRISLEQHDNLMAKWILPLNLKVCLTQRGMLPLKDGNIIVYPDGVNYKL